MKPDKVLKELKKWLDNKNIGVLLEPWRIKEKIKELEDELE